MEGRLVEEPLLIFGWSRLEARLHLKYKTTVLPNFDKTKVTEITEVNLSAFGYRLFHEDFSSICGTLYHKTKVKMCFIESRDKEKGNDSFKNDWTLNQRTQIKIWKRETKRLSELDCQ